MYNVFLHIMDGCPYCIMDIGHYHFPLNLSEPLRGRIFFCNMKPMNISQLTQPGGSCFTIQVHWQRGNRCVRYEKVILCHEAMHGSCSTRYCAFDSVEASSFNFVHFGYTNNVAILIRNYVHMDFLFPMWTLNNNNKNESKDTKNRTKTKPKPHRTGENGIEQSSWDTTQPVGYYIGNNNNNFYIRTQNSQTDLCCFFFFICWLKMTEYWVRLDLWMLKWTVLR